MPSHETHTARELSEKLARAEDERLTAQRRLQAVTATLREIAQGRFTEDGARAEARRTLDGPNASGR
jgi:hypothetical protein